MPADARRFAPLPTITGTLGTLLLALCTCILHLRLHLHCALYAVPGQRARHNSEITVHSVCVCVCVCVQAQALPLVAACDGCAAPALAAVASAGFNVSSQPAMIVLGKGRLPGLLVLLVSTSASVIATTTTATTTTTMTRTIRHAGN